MQADQTEKHFFGNAAAIIREAAATPLGIIALVVLALAFLAVTFFLRATSQIQLVVFAALLFAASLLVASVISVSRSPQVEPTRQQDSPVPPLRGDPRSKPRVIINSGLGPDKSEYDVVVIESDTYLVLGAEPYAKEVTAVPKAVARSLDDTFPKHRGSVIINDLTKPVVFTAVVHDLDRDPTTDEKIISTVINKVLRSADERELASIVLPALGVQLGVVTSGRFVRVLAQALSVTQFHSVSQIILHVPEGPSRLELEPLQAWM